MKPIKLIFVPVIFFLLSYVALNFLEYKILINYSDVQVPEFNYKLVYSGIFSLVVFITLFLIEEIKFNGILILFSLSFVGFLLDYFILQFLVSYTISESAVSTKLDIDFKNFYYFSLMPFILLVLGAALKAMKFKYILKKIPVFVKLDNLLISRIIAFVVDWFILIVICVVLSWFHFILWLPVEALLGIFVYRFAFEYACSCTPGKKIVGIEIIGKKSEELSLKEALIRNFSRITLFYWIPIISNKTGWHEEWSATKTVYKKA